MRTFGWILSLSITFACDAFASELLTTCTDNETRKYSVFLDPTQHTGEISVEVPGEGGASYTYRVRNMKLKTYGQNYEIYFSEDNYFANQILWVYNSSVRVLIFDKQQNKQRFLGDCDL